jgi:hypothetical protein
MRRGFGREYSEFARGKIETLAQKSVSEDLNGPNTSPFEKSFHQDSQTFTLTTTFFQN